MQSTINTAIDLTRALVQIPSESSSPTRTAKAPEAGVVALLKNYCKERHLPYYLQEVRPERHNFIIHLPQPAAPKILITAHLDTVGALGMTKPFAAELKDDKIWGRGACDDKGSLATVLAVLFHLKKHSIPLRYDLTFVGTIDEECSMAGSAKLAAANPNGWDLCLAMEPSLLKPISTHIGVYRCRILPGGQLTDDHGEQISKAETIRQLLPSLEKLKKELTETYHPKLGRTKMTITEINQEEAGQNQTSHRILIDIRLLPSQSPAAIHKSIVRTVGNRAKIIPLFTGLGIDSSPDHPIIRDFQTSIAKMSQPAELIAVPYPSDCSQLRGRGTCFVWGPGNPDHAHTNEEHIEISQLENACRILVDFLQANQSNKSIL